MLRLSEKMDRLGTETAFEVLARAETLAREGRDIINLGIGQPDFKTPPHVVEAGIQALRDGHHDLPNFFRIIINQPRAVFVSFSFFFFSCHYFL